MTEMATQPSRKACHWLRGKYGLVFVAALVLLTSCTQPWTSDRRQSDLVVLRGFGNPEYAATPTRLFVYTTSGTLIRRQKAGFSRLLKGPSGGQVAVGVGWAAGKTTRVLVVPGVGTSRAHELAKDAWFVTLDSSGRKIAYVQQFETGRLRVRVARIDRNRLQYVGLQEPWFAGVEAIEWSKTGEKLAVIGRRASKKAYKLFSFSVRGEDASQRTSAFSGVIKLFGWVDGRSILVRTGVRELRALDTATGRRTGLLTLSSIPYSGQVSPDGRRVVLVERERVFGNTSAGRGPRYFEYLTVRRLMDGKKLSAKIRNSFSEPVLKWSPDGRYVAFQSSITSRIGILDVLNNRTIYLSNVAGTPRGFAWLQTSQAR